MALWEYHCATCGTASEAIRKVDERDLPFPCPVCGGITERVEFYQTHFDIPAFHQGQAIRIDE
jgi:putative FmdB family regulatory protein